MSDTATNRNSAAMTAAEFRIAREHLGVTGDWIAWQLDVTGRTVRRWEQGSARIPAGAAQEVRALVDHQDAFVAALIERCRIDGPDEDGTAWAATYPDDESLAEEHPEVEYPASWHRAAMGRVAASVGWLRLRYLDEDVQR